VPDALAGLGAALNKAALIEAQKKLLADTETVYPKDEDAAKKGDVDTGMSVFTNTDTYKDTEDISPICPAPKCPDVLFPITCNGVTKTFEPDPQNGCEPPNIKCPRTTFDVSQLPDWLKERVWYSLPSKWRWCADWRWWKVPFCSYGRKKEQNGRIDVDYANDGNRKLKENGDIFLQNKLYTIGEEDPKTGIDVPYLKTKCSDTCVLNHNLCVIDAVSNLPDNDQDKNQDNEQGEALAEACDICMQVWVAEEECEEGCILPYKGVLASPEIDR
jgi:hypothetical protein